MKNKATFVTVIAVLAVSQPMSSVSAAPQPGLMVKCHGMPMTLQQAADALRNAYPNGWVASLNPTDEKFTGFYGKTKSDKIFIVWNGNGDSSALNNANLTFLKREGPSTADYEYQTAGYVYYYIDPVMSGAIINNEGVYDTGVSNSGIQVSEIACVSEAAGNVIYHSNWDGPTYNLNSYVAMGDSFSSGEGNPSFEVGTNTAANKCHRSPYAYARLLSKDPALNLGTTAFVACSGATTENIVRGQYNEKAQTNALSKDTKVVTITIGGNDVGFGDFATACTTGPCDYSTKAYSEIRRKINYELPEKLTRVFSAIDSKTSVATKVYVIGYPHIAPSKMPTSACWPLNGGFDRKDPATGDGAAVRNVVNELNQMIQKKVESYKSTKFSFVNVNKSGSPFEGHDWCKTDRYFQLIAVNSVPYSFHPNIKGHEAYRDIVKGAMLAK